MAEDQHGNELTPYRSRLVAPEEPAPDPRYARRWRTLRWGMITHFGSYLLWLPGGILAMSTWQPLGYVLIPTLAIAFMGGGLVVWTFHCPRCGDRFFDDLFAGQFDWIARRRCSSCQLQRGAPYNPAQATGGTSPERNVARRPHAASSGGRLDQRWREERRRYSRAWAGMLRANAIFWVALVAAGGAVIVTRLAFFPTTLIAAAALGCLLARRAALQCPRCQSQFTKGLLLREVCQSCSWPRGKLPGPDEVEEPRRLPG